MKTKNLEFLRNLDNMINDKKSIRLTNKYWENEQKELDKIKNDNEKISDSLSMSKEKFHQNFSL